jgi:hypothetical protein
MSGADRPGEGQTDFIAVHLLCRWAARGARRSAPFVPASLRGLNQDILHTLARGWVHSLGSFGETGPAWIREAGCGQAEETPTPARRSQELCANALWRPLP